MRDYKSAAQRYKAQAVLSAPRLKLVQMLYDEALLRLRKASQILEEGDLTGFRKQVTKAQEIVAELFASLNYEKGKDIAHDLASLYEFCMSSLIDASNNKAQSSIEAVVKVLGTLEQGWDNIVDHEEGGP